MWYSYNFLLISLLGKTPFNGKNYNEILAQNRASNISFEGTDYLKLPLPGKLWNSFLFLLFLPLTQHDLNMFVFVFFPSAYDLLKKMLDNDPKTRIPAKKAL